MNRISDEDPFSLRIAVDSKAKVNIGEFSRNGRSRDKESRKAADHDMNPIAKSVLFGIPNVVSGASDFFFGTSAETSDFIADCLESWWKANKGIYGNIKKLIINTEE